MKHLKEFTVTLTAATKTFNLAGIKNSMLFIPNEKNYGNLSYLYKTKKSSRRHQYFLATLERQFAYQTGEEWLTALLDYLKRKY